MQRLMKMGLLKSVDNVPGIDYYEYREHDYWDKFKYRARLKIPGAHYTYWADDIEAWKDRVIRGRSWRGASTKEEKENMLSHADVVAKFLALKNTLKKTKSKNFSLRIEGNTTAIFSNDLAFLHELKNWGTTVDITEVIRSEFQGVKYFVNDPPNNYRVYLKSKRVDPSVQKELRALIQSQTGLIPSKALKSWFQNSGNWKSRFLSSSYFIEYNDESTLSYLAIMHGDILGRKYKLEKRPVTE